MRFSVLAAGFMTGFGLALDPSSHTANPTTTEIEEYEGPVGGSIVKAQMELEKLSHLSVAGGIDDGIGICDDSELVEIPSYRGLSTVLRVCPPVCATEHGAPVEAARDAWVQLNWTTEFGSCYAPINTCEKMLCKYGKAAIWFCNTLGDKGYTVDCNYPATVARYIDEKCRYKHSRRWFSAGKTLAYTPKGVLFRTDLHDCVWPESS